MIIKLYNNGNGSRCVVCNIKDVHLFENTYNCYVIIQGEKYHIDTSEFSRIADLINKAEAVDQLIEKEKAL